MSRVLKLVHQGSPWVLYLKIIDPKACFLFCHSMWAYIHFKNIIWNSSVYTKYHTNLLAMWLLLKISLETKISASCCISSMLMLKLKTRESDKNVIPGFKWIFKDFVCVYKTYICVYMCDNRPPMARSALIPQFALHVGLPSIPSQTLGSSRAMFLKSPYPSYVSFSICWVDKKVNGWGKYISRPDSIPKEPSPGT